MEDASAHWVFGYGSLIWNPGFEYMRAAPATLNGYHRSLCVLSHKYRGTVEANGLVFGLNAGGRCHGMAFNVSAKAWPETLAYLRAREQITMVYMEKLLPVTIMETGLDVHAIAYVVDTRHPQYAGALNEADTLRYIRQGHGEAGPCAEYVRNTAEHLREMGFSDPDLDRLLGRL